MEEKKKYVPGAKRNSIAMLKIFLPVPVRRLLK